MIYDLVPETDPILHAPVAEFDFSNPPIDPMELTKNLATTMLAKRGVGLAANQCGLAHRVFVYQEEESGIPRVAFNPKITTQSGEQLSEEGCLSFPGLGLKVKRAQAVTLVAQDENGETFEKVLGGRDAIVAQHETDHLNGITFTKKVSRLKLDMARKRATK